MVKGWNLDERRRDILLWLRTLVFLVLLTAPAATCARWLRPAVELAMYDIVTDLVLRITYSVDHSVRAHRRG